MQLVGGMTSELDGVSGRVGLLYTGQDLDEGPRNVTHLIVDSSVKSIPFTAFEKRSSLKKVDIEEGVEVIGQHSFQFCPKLNQMTFPSTLLAIEEGALQDTGLARLELPESLCFVGKFAFNYCNALRIVSFRSAATKIERSVFSFSSSLIHVKLPEDLSQIPPGLFVECTSLTCQRIPSKAKKIATQDGIYGTFQNCSSLLSVELPREIACLGKSGGQQPTFKNCCSLINIALPPSISEVEADTFVGCDGLTQVFPQHVDLVSALKHRFDNLPVHELCYYHTYDPQTELIQKLMHALERDSSVCTKVDIFGMTPFHILALSAEPNCELFEKLLHSSPVGILDEQDSHGRTTWDCFGVNDTPHSSSLIKHVIGLNITKRLKQLGMDRWRYQVQNEIDKAFNILDDDKGSTSARRRQLNTMVLLLKRFECLDNISLIDTFLWQMKIVEVLSYESSALLDPEVKRNCRVNCGSEIVIPHVMAFVGGFAEEAMSLSSEEELSEHYSEEEESSESEDENDYFIRHLSEFS